MSEGFSCRGVLDVARAEGMEMAAPSLAQHYVCPAVLPTGWCWGAFLGHAVRQECVESAIDERSP
eukprot:7743742-Lingulodinium_polyedra.AAC.1